MESTSYLTRFILIICGVVALSLAGLQQITEPRSASFEEIFNKKSVLQAVEDHLPEGKSLADLSNDEVLKIFDEQIQQVVVNTAGDEISDVVAQKIDMKQERKKPENEQNLPLFIYQNGNDKFFIAKIRGKGLWDDIWGNVALQSDLNTIAGVVFDHQAETPGLGAEIKDNPDFRAQFKGKKLYNSSGQYVSINVRKGGAKDPNHEVDGISGATITSDGVTEMMVRGLKYYEPYFKKL